MKVPRRRQDADVARVAVARHGAARRSLVPQRVEHRGAVDDTARHQMDDTLLAALHFALDQHQPRRHDGAALALEMPRPEQSVDDPALVLDRDEDRIRSEEHTSELQSLMRTSYDACCFKKKTNKENINAN